MSNTKDNSGITIVALVITMIISLILIMVVLVEIDRGIFEHTNKYVTDIKNSNNEEKKIENQFINECEEYL